MALKIVEHPAHDSAVEICGRTFWVRRDMALIRRIEQAFGPLGPFAGRMRDCAVTMDEIARAYETVLRSEEGKPSRAEVEADIYRMGVQIAVVPLIKLWLACFMGLDAAERMDQAEEAGRDDGAARPRPAA